MKRSSPHETEFQKRVHDALNGPNRQTRVWRQNAGRLVVLGTDGARRAVHGAPDGAGDLNGVVRPEGWHIEIELKIGAAHTAVQQRWQAFIESMGGIYVLIRYDRVLSEEENVAAAVDIVDSAILARRSR